MSRRDVATTMTVIAVLGVLGVLVFLAPEASEERVAVYAPVDIPGTVMTASAPALYRVDAWTTLHQPGFVTIHKSMGGAPGELIGQSPYLDTTTVISSIALNPLLTPGGDYIALLFVDDGDGVFELGVDLPVTNDGQPVRADFTAPEESQTE